VAKLVDALDLSRDYVIVAGDLNSDPTSASLKPLLAKSDLYNVNFELPPKERGTYRTGNKQLDYLVVSDALRRKLTEVHIERRGLFSRKTEIYPTVTSRKTEASDHAAVLASFRL